jgi:hypothetical protein
MRTGIFILCLSLASCVSKNGGEFPQNVYGDSMTCSLQEVNVSSSEVLQLKDYPITGFIGADSLQSIVGYNYRTHSLDKIVLSEHPSMSSLELSKEGPNGVLARVASICPVSEDSIWVYDGTFISLLNDRGEVCRKIPFPSDVQVLLETNYAMHTAKLYYDRETSSLYYPVLRADSVFVEEYNLSKDAVVNSYFLKPSLLNPDNVAEYGDLRFPNVNVVNGKIIYNYPYESTIYLMNMKTGEYAEVGAASKYTSNAAPRCDAKADYSVWQRYGLENTHFYDVMYLPDSQIYARFHVEGKSMSASEELTQEFFDSKSLYLMLFDSDFRIIGEKPMKARTYSLFTSWCALPNAVSVFKNNSLADSLNYEVLSLDLILPNK